MAIERNMDCLLNGLKRLVFKKQRYIDSRDGARKVREQPSPSCLQHSPLGSLPRELILSIVDHLNPSAAASFTFTCSAIYNILGTKYWKLLNKPTNRIERLEFLSLIQPLHYIACQPCETLHKADRPFHERRLIEGKGKFSCKRTDAVAHRYLHMEFSYAIFQMAMKQHRLGMDTTLHLELLSRCHTHYDDGIMNQYNSHARIVNGNLLLRSQIWWATPKDVEKTHFGVMWKYPCPHWHDDALPNIEEPGMPSSPLRKHVDELLENWNRLKVEHRAPEKLVSRLIGCRGCPTQFQFHILDFESKGEAWVITRWKDLGKGLSRDDVKWRSHHKLLALDPVRHVEDVSVIEQQTSLKMLFEEDRIEKGGEANELLSHRGTDQHESWLQDKWWHKCRLMWEREEDEVHLCGDSWALPDLPGLYEPLEIVNGDTG